MNLFQKLIAIFFTLIVLLIIVYVFSTNIIKSSVPDYKHRIFKSENLNDTVSIFRNEFWIPHIIAKNEDDLFYTIGYCQAQDRLWQMDFSRRAVQGKLSEIFGDETVEIDLFLRSFGINYIAEDYLKNASKKTISILESYSKGVNDFIENNKNNVGFEFGALNYYPDKWTPIDCLCIGKGIALELSIPFWSEIALGEIADKLGQSKTMELIPDWFPEDPYILSDSVILKKESRTISQGRIIYDNKDIFTELSNRISKVKYYLGITGSSIGSNSWAVSAKRSPKSASILANDPHLSLGLPPKWYPLHITCPGFNVIGLSIPGIPLPIIGRNDEIAWGITNIMIDDCDFYIELIDSTNQDYYYDSKFQKQKFEYIPDTIKIKNNEPFIYYLRKTKSSFVISDFHLFNHPEKILELNFHNFTNKYHRQNCITFNWTAKHIKDELLALYRINKAHNWNEFQKGLEMWGAPGQNFTYIDKQGNIGIIPAGVIPIRDLNCNPNLPNPRWVDKTDWLGYYNPKFLGYKFNPKNRFVFSANNNISSNIKTYISSYFEPASRAKRIKDLLEQIINYSARDAMTMQYDLYSYYALELMNHCIDVLNKSEQLMNPIEKEALKHLIQWDYLIGEKSPSASIFNSFLERLLFKTFADELGERLYRQYTLVSNIPLRKLLELISDPHNEWFDDINTVENENRDYIIFESFRESIEALLLKFNDDNTDNWHWSKIHQLSLLHPFSRNNFLKHNVTLGPVPMGGNITTLNNTEWRIFKPFDIVLGASARFVADMSNDIVYINVPGGVSGNPLSPHYSDQLQLWARGGYISLEFTTDRRESFNPSITIVPK